MFYLQKGKRHVPAASITNDRKRKKTIILLIEAKVTDAVGFEPTRAWHNGFQVHLLNHSDKHPRVSAVEIK
jgi:hypothetical protein